MIVKLPTKRSEKIKDSTKKGEVSPNWDSVVVLSNIVLLDCHNLSGGKKMLVNSGLVGAHMSNPPCDGLAQ